MAKYSEEVYNKIEELYKQNYKIFQIADMCGCSTDTVSRTLVKRGLKKSKLSPQIEKIKQSVINDFVNNHMYCKDIATKYSIDEHTVYKILDSENIERQSGYHSNCVLNYFETIDSPNKAYLLGFITADGAIVNDVLSIEVHKDDVEVLEFAKNEINKKATLTPHKDCFRVCFSAKQLAYDLRKYGIVQNKSKILEKVPVDLIPDNLLQFYFRGLIDGDGCVKKDGTLCIYSGSYDFIKDVQKILVEKVGIKQLGIYEGTTYFIQWGSKIDKQKLFNFLYSDLSNGFCYKRKYERLKKAIQDNTEVNS